MEQTPHFRQTLNNYLQEAYRVDPSDHLGWETSRVGPDHRPTWHAIAYLDGVEWGRGNGPNLDAAKESAAEKVLLALNSKKAKS